MASQTFQIVLNQEAIAPCRPKMIHLTTPTLLLFVSLASDFINNSPSSLRFISLTSLSIQQQRRTLRYDRAFAQIHSLIY
ncbi:MAG: hypothetical protein ACYT04_82185 [Nostoc sp.]